MPRPNWPMLALALALVGCLDKDDDDDAGDDTAEGETAACELAAEWNACDECYSGEVTCSYGETSVTEASCVDCQARSALYAALCEAGVTDSREDIEAGTECSDPR